MPIIEATSRITRLERPRHFRDSQVSGAFRRFDHDHFFTVEAGSTVMRDVFDYDSPFGFFGRFADHCFLRSYTERLLKQRAHVIKQPQKRLHDHYVGKCDD